MHLTRIGTEIRGGHRDHQTPAVRHRVARVQSEVHQNLLDLATISENRELFPWELEVELDGFANQPPEHTRRFVEDGIQVDCDERHRLLPTEGEQLSSQSGATRHDLAQLVQVGLRFVVGAKPMR